MRAVCKVAVKEETDFFIARRLKRWLCRAKNLKHWGCLLVGRYIAPLLCAPPIFGSRWAYSVINGYGLEGYFAGRLTKPWRFNGAYESISLTNSIFRGLCPWLLSWGNSLFHFNGWSKILGSSIIHGLFFIGLFFKCVLPLPVYSDCFVRINGIFNKIRHLCGDRLISKSLKDGFQKIYRPSKIFYQRFFNRLLNGLLPCGLVYLALIKLFCHRKPFLDSVVFMAVFGYGVLCLG